MKIISRIVICPPYRSITTKAPRVRFAPSPTGYLHLGGLRTALYNKLFAKSHNGSLVLRIEDTDQTRKVTGSKEALIKDLEWTGIQCDEGPGIGGNVGPYIQSERLDIYQKYIGRLLENGSAYRCFCTEHRLNLLRRHALKSQSVPKYDNRCRGYSIQEVKYKLNAGVPYCIRFQLSPACQYFEDLIFGGIAYDVSINEGDPVLMKSDGFPTYHFANVVDDYLMGITHVLRGVEWQISTTKHLLIYSDKSIIFIQKVSFGEVELMMKTIDGHRNSSMVPISRAFGWQPPLFGHLPLIVNADGTKLSKRQQDVTVDDYKRKGVFPLALVNYITLSGGGFDHMPGSGIVLKCMDELAQEITRISSHPSRLNPDLLKECNKLEIKRRLLDKNQSKNLVHQLRQLVEESYPEKKLNVSFEHIQSVLEWATARISTLEELVDIKYAFLWILPTKHNHIEISKDILEMLLHDLESLSVYDQTHLKQSLKEFSIKNNLKFPIFMKQLRSILSGLGEGPSVAEMLYLLGKNQSLMRIRAVIR